MMSITLANLSPSCSLLSKGSSMALYPPQASPTSIRYESLIGPHRISIAAGIIFPTGLSIGLLPMHLHRSRNRTVFAFAGSHEEPKPLEIEEGEEKSDIQVEDEESEEAWKQTLASFKEQALKMQSVSQEAYEVYSKKAIIILKETSEQLKIQAEKVTQDLSVFTKDFSEESKEYLSTAAQKSPEPVKDIVETFVSSTDDVKDISNVLDFYLGIPYGILLSSGGFLSFMLTGSISAIRFGVILGGALLALSICSLRSWRRGESYPLALKGQAAIATILLLRELRVLFEIPSLARFFTTLFSGAMVVFYLYRITQSGGQTGASKSEPGTG